MKNNIKRNVLAWAKTLRHTVLATVLFTGISGIVPVIAQADSNWQSLPNGTVVQQQSLALPSALQAVASGVRVVYVTTDVNNNKVVSSGIIMTPYSHPAHPKIVAWAHATTGIDDHCAPSVDPTNEYYPEAVDAAVSYLQNGWVVTASDYQGLGTPGIHEYLIGNTEARSVIDSVRAARNLNVNLSNQWVVAGHSEGGQAALFTGEIADTYGQGMQLKGVVAFAPASNLDLIASALPGTPLNGYLPLGLIGLSRVDPSIHPLQILAQPARQLLPVLHTGCIDDILNAYGSLTADQMVNGGVLPDAVIADFAHYGNPAQEANSAPALLVQGTDDETVPPDLTAYLQSQMCAYSTPVDLELIDGATHDDVPSLTLSLVSSYIQARFAGQTAPSNCQ